MSKVIIGYSFRWGLSQEWQSKAKVIDTEKGLVSEFVDKLLYQYDGNVRIDCIYEESFQTNS